MITLPTNHRSGLADARLAASLAAGAGEALMILRAASRPGGVKAAAELRRAGDATAQSWLAAALADARPDDAVLSEEAADDARRLSSDRAWIIDPLDGTREFAEHRHDGAWRDDFAVHVALWRRGRGLTDAAVALPARDLVLATDAPVVPDEAAARDVLAGRRRLRIAVSRSRPPAVARLLGERDDIELVPMGSTGFKSMAVLRGVVDAYVHAGGQYEWDSAAPVAVALASGFVATRLDGSPLEYNRRDPWSPDLVICHPALDGRLRMLLAEAGKKPATEIAR